MRRRLIVVLAAVIPLAALVIAVAVAGGGGSSSSPRKLPVAFGSGGGQSTSAKAADAAFAPGGYGYGGVTYVAAGDLPDLGGNAHAYQVISDANDASIRSLADALGVQGDPVEQYPGYLTIGEGDRQLSIDRATGSWYLSSTVSSGVATSSGSGYACPAVAPGEPVPDCLPPPDLPTTTIPTRPADLPSQDEAKAKALDLLRATGMDVDAAHVTVDDYTTSWQITVDTVVDGKTVQGFGASVAIGSGGAIDYASGYLAHASAVDEYPLLTTRQAIDLLNKNQIVPMMAVDTATATGGGSATGGELTCEETKASTGDGVEVQLPCASPATTVIATTDTATCGAIVQLPDGTQSRPCEPIPMPTEPPVPPTTYAPQVVTITAATNALTMLPTYDGKSAYLVPAYAFTANDGSNPTAMAIDASWFAPLPDSSYSDCGIASDGTDLSLESGSCASGGGGQPGSVDPASPAIPPGAIETPCTTIYGMSDVGPCYVFPDTAPAAGAGDAPAPNTATTVP